MMDYELKLEGYKGPLETLLDLVVEKKMEITMVSLAEVTGDFLNHVAALEEDSRYRGLVADFLVIASKLIFIKSKVLLPSLPLTKEEEDDIKNLEDRLKLYQRLKNAEIFIKERWSPVSQMGTREFLMSSERVFFPPNTITAETLLAMVRRVSGELEKISIPVEKVEGVVISLKQKIQEVLQRITGTPSSFAEMKNGKSKGEIVVLFLAVLHLIKDQLLDAEQDGHFSEILVAKHAQSE
jgi:segregation and condensation protein A